MGNVLPIHFRKAADFQVQYTFIETMSNVGFVRFYPCNSRKTGPVDTKFLAVKTIESYPDKTTNNSDSDFDWEFKIPATVAADDVIVNLTQKSVALKESIVTVNIYHVSLAAAETLIGTFVCISRNDGSYYRECMQIPVSQKSFAIGEKLRVNIVMTGDADGGKHYYNDPTSPLTVVDDRGRTVGTDLTVDVPFKINI